MDKLYHGDCLDVLRQILDGSVDMILCDPPFGTTVCKWDAVIPFEPMWEQIWRVLKPNGACLFFASSVFTAKLILSQADFYKYSLVWNKNRVGNFAQAPYRFLSEHEDIVVFSRAGVTKNSKLRMCYYPQGTGSCERVCNGKAHSDLRPTKVRQADYIQTRTNYPKSILKFASEFSTVHPTQKPVPLLEYLIKSYTLEGETVLDFTMGSGSTGVACVNTHRKFIGIEKEQRYFEVAQKRIREVEGSLF